MADTTYRVVLALETTGTLGTRLGEINTKLDSAHYGAQRFQHGMVLAGEMGARALEHVGQFLESVADKIIHIGELGATVGIGAAFATAAYGVTHLNRELEETQISLGAIFQAQGFASNFTDAFKMGSAQIAKMKQDVKTLPGDLGQLSAIMSSIATPAAQGGMGPDEIRRLAGQSMLVGRIVLGAQADNAMIAREMANLLSGRAGAHNIMGLRLGLAGEAAKKFNAMTAQERVAEIEGIFEKYKGANDKFAQSFIANWTTLKDNVKYGFLADATAPLFDAVKRTMASINTWFDQNQEKVKSWAGAFGTRLAAGWEEVIAGAERFGPALENLGMRFFELWDKAVSKARELEPLLMRVAGFFEHLTIQDIGRGAKDLAELKLAGMGLQAAGGAVHAGMQGLMMARLMGFAGGASSGGGAAAGAAGAAEAAGGFSALSVALPLAIVGASGLAGAIDDLTDKTNKYHSEATALAKDISENATTVWHQLGEAVQPALGKLREFGDYLGLGLLQDVEAGSNAVVAFGNLLKYLKDSFSHPGESADDAMARAAFKASIDTPGAIKEHEMPTVIGGLGNTFREILQEQKRKLPGGGGGTHISKVEIVVRGSGDPSRVARLVKTELEKIARNPTSSPHVAKWAEARF